MSNRPIPGPRPRPWRTPWLLLLLPPLFWAGNTVIARALSDAVPPVALAFWRWALALALLSPFVARPLWRARRTVLARWPVLLALGASGVAGYNTFVYVALQTTTTVNATIMNSAIPVLIPLFAWAIAGERVTRPQAAGIALSLVGAVWIAGRGEIAALRALAFHPGDLWMMLAVIAWAVYSVLLRYRPADLAPTVLLGALVLFGLPVLVPFWLWERASGAVMPVTGAAMAAVLYVALFASVLAYVAWNRSVAVLGATVTGLSIHLLPVFATALAVLFLGETVEGFHLVGAGLILAGLWLTTAAGRQPRARATGGTVRAAAPPRSGDPGPC